MTWKVVLLLRGGVVYVPLQVFPLQDGAGILVVVFVVTFSTDHEEPLFGPLNVNVTVCPDWMVEGDAVKVIGTIVRVADFAWEFVEPEVATA